MKYSFDIWPMWESGDRHASHPVDMQHAIYCALAVCRETTTILPLTIRVPKYGPLGCKPHYDHYMAQLDFTCLESTEESIQEVKRMSELAFANEFISAN